MCGKASASTVKAKRKGSRNSPRNVSLRRPGAQRRDAESASWIPWRAPSTIAACLAQATEFGGPNGRCIGGGKANVVYAALYNTALVRYLDFMDSYLAGGETVHPMGQHGRRARRLRHGTIGQRVLDRAGGRLPSRGADRLPPPPLWNGGSRSPPHSLPTRSCRRTPKRSARLTKKKRHGSENVGQRDFRSPLAVGPNFAMEGPLLGAGGVWLRRCGLPGVARSDCTHIIEGSCGLDQALDHPSTSTGSRQNWIGSTNSR